MPDPKPEFPKGLEHAAGEIGRTRINHGVVISERHLAEQFEVVVSIKRPPPAVGVLHGFDPGRGPFHGRRGAGQTLLHGRIGRQRLLSRRTPSGQRDQHHGRVVDIGIEAIGILETPAGRLGHGGAADPVAGPAHFVVEQPVDGVVQLLRGGNAARDVEIAGCCEGIGERPQRDRRIPDGRAARLDAGRTIRLDLDEPCQLLPTLLHLGRCILAAQRPQRHNAPDDWRKDRPQAGAALEPLEHPPAALRNGTAAQRPKAEGITNFYGAIDTAKEPRPGVVATGLRRRAVQVLRPKEFGDTALGVDVANRLEGPDERQRHDHRA